jgi:glycerophosphoryl diester phosphodiesterase
MPKSDAFKTSFFTKTLLLTLSFYMQQCSSHRPEQFDWQGHRGARMHRPENTVPAFLFALQHQNITTLEMDVVITSDQQVILSHEPWFSYEITTLPDGSTFSEKDEQQYNLYNMQLAQVKTFDVGMKPHPRFGKQTKIPATKPTLAEVIQAVNQDKRGSTIKFNIEIKSEPAHDSIFTPLPSIFADLLMEQITQLGIAKRSTVQSFDVRPLQYLHTKYPEMQLALLVENHDGFKTNIERLGFTPQIYSPNFSLVTPKLVENCHEKGMSIIPWTVNQDSIAKVLIKMGVDGLITDDPSLSD